ncbi:MAG TPA: cytochrome-c peroxidase [Candidatus Binatia bacterium]|jgi:cytochrome c peroxidase
MRNLFSRLLPVAFVLAVPVPALAVTAPWPPLPTEAPAPADNPTTPAKVELGKKLFFDPRVSVDGTVSCNSCHNVMEAGVDDRPQSGGVRGQRGARSSPTVYNAAFLSVQFWDGRAPSLEEQAKGPIVNPVEMGMKDHAAVTGRIAAIPAYFSEFESVFGKDGLTIDNFARAIAAYERTLITPDSAYDRYARGDESALSEQQKRGMQTVLATGCTACHSGVDFAGPPLPPGQGFYQKVPLIPGSQYETKYDLTSDIGREQATKNPADHNMWRVPSWRNIALTAPYFHNGSVATLDEAVRVMAKIQLGKDLDEQQVADIVSFLESLTGKFPEQTMPRLPSVEAKTVVPVDPK